MRAPALFFSHGAPTLAIEPGDYGRALEDFGRRLAPRPRAIVVFSGHFEEPLPARATAAERPPLIYDFGGFPDEMYRIQYPAPGDPKLAQEITGLLRGAGIPSALDGSRGWIVLAGSGGIVHNLRRVKFGAGGAIDGWAEEFDAWAAGRLAAMDVGSLVRYRSEAPHADRRADRRALQPVVRRAPGFRPRHSLTRTAAERALRLEKTPGGR
ncbi:MAG: dioxygenase [Acidobacteriota bacterium]|nr:dioxygenase [Acidobacteriota bacterium]